MIHSGRKAQWFGTDAALPTKLSNENAINKTESKYDFHAYAAEAAWLREEK